MDYDELRRRMRQRVPLSASWYDIRLQDDDRAVVRIYDEISMWGVTADDLASELDDIDAAEIEVQINSPGGSVFDGIAIFNALRTHSARVVTRVDGIAASAASVIVQAGDERVMVESGQMMIHEAWGLAVGDAEVMLEMAELLDRQSGVIAELYANRADGDAEEFRELMRSETWLTDDEAVELGLADSVLVPDRQNASLADLRPVQGLRDVAASAFNVGRTLSAANRDRIETAIDKLESVLEDASDPEDSSAREREDGDSTDGAATVGQLTQLLDVLDPKEGDDE